MAPSAPKPNTIPAPGKQFLVTGGGGYIGSALCKQIIADGHSLTVWGRTRPKTLSPDHYLFHPYDMRHPLPSEGLSEADVVIHLAHDMSDTEDLNINQTATMTLRDAVRNQPGTLFIFISSQSAQADAPSPYGRIKWQIEKRLDGSQDIIVRPGFVYGGAAGGSFGTLVQLLKKLPVLPVVGYHTHLQPVHIEDLCLALLNIASHTQPRNLYQIAAPEPVTFGAFLNHLARHRLRRRVLIVPVPLTIALWGAKFCRWVPGLPNVSSDRILGLVRITRMDTADDQEHLKLSLRDLVAGTADRKTASRRALLREGRVLLRYISGKKPPCQWVRRYVRALTFEESVVPLHLPRLSFYMPGILRLIEPLPGSQTELCRRLEVAISIAETSPQGVAVFAAYDSPSRVFPLIRLALTLVVETFLLPLRLLRR